MDTMLNEVDKKILEIIDMHTMKMGSAHFDLIKISYSIHKNGSFGSFSMRDGSISVLVRSSILNLKSLNLIVEDKIGIIRLTTPEEIVRGKS